MGERAGCCGIGIPRSRDRLRGDAATGRGSEAVDDAGFVGVVGGHFDFDAVADDEADEALAHFAGDVGEDFVGVREFDPEHGACEDGGDGAFEFDGGFFVLRFFLIAANGVSAGEGTAVTGVSAGAALEAFFWRRHDLEGGALAACGAGAQRTCNVLPVGRADKSYFRFGSKRRPVSGSGK